MVGQLSMASGIQITILQSREVCVKGGLRGITIYGDRGSLKTTESGYVLFDRDGEAGTADWPTPELSDYALEMQAFFRYVTEGRPGPTSAESERRSLAVVQAGYESAESGQVINIAERFGSL